MVSKEGWGLDAVRMKVEVEGVTEAGMIIKAASTTK
jgi:hypothetical protein